MNHPADSSHLHTRKGQASWTALTKKERKKKVKEVHLFICLHQLFVIPQETRRESPRSFVLAREDNLKALAGFDLLIFSLGL